MSFHLGRSTRFESTWTIEAADVEGSSSAKEGYDVVFRGSFDILLVSSNSGKANSSVTMLYDRGEGV
jgi:hypothetical protein